MLTISENSHAEIVVKKSKFIANVFYVESEEEAKELIMQTKKKYFDAKHNCYAYIINEISDDKNQLNAVNKIERSSDDGEPSKTAGAPILDVIKRQELSNVLVIVTRYFGGILLGTGGLVKAYSTATIEAIENAKKVTKHMGKVIEFSVRYDDLKDLKHYLSEIDAQILNENFGENVKIDAAISNENLEKLKKLQEKNNSNILLSEKILNDNKWI